ncbi:hypothetical protein AMTRI_Chr09g38990 [Amborella trichopoda]
MESGFHFDAFSSEEEEDEREEEIEETEDQEEEVDEEEEEHLSRPRRARQSPWEFSAYSESAAEEHARRSTTSVEDKILRARQQPNFSFPDPEENESAVSEPDKRENYYEVEDADAGQAHKAPKSFFSSSEGSSFSANSFLELNLSRPLLRACEALGYQKPTPIQAACIPLALTGRDICGSAITGSGKTAAFGLPVLERLLFRPKRVPAIRVLVLTPTRELAVQVHSMIEKLAQFTDIRCSLVLGGLSMKVQETALRSRPDVVVATPGRMIDHLRNSQSVGLEDLAVLILDEADRLLELGFSAEIHELVRLCPKRRQTMLFSATMTEEVDELIKLSLTSPVRLSADPSTKRPSTLTEEVIRIRPMREANQEAVLLALCSRTFTSKVIIFSGTKQAAHRLRILFGLSGFKAAELHGNLTQVQRLDALELFRKQEVDFLIATDVAARGLDIVGVQTVINFACPRDITSYVHRVGRTARAGREGYAVTFVTERDRPLLKAMARKAGSKLLSRMVAESSVINWGQIIEQMEDQVAAVLEEEREERALRKAEMEATKAENMIEHKNEIYARPRKTWFETEKEKKLTAKTAKAVKGNTSGANERMSVEQADILKMKKERRREREKSMPRKKRRRLEAAKEKLEDENEVDNDLDEGGEKKSGKSLVDLAYQRARSVKAIQKAREAGKIVKKADKSSRRPSQSTQSRKEENEELFQSDMSARKQFHGSKKNARGAGRRKKSKNAFKSKSR